MSEADTMAAEMREALGGLQTSVLWVTKAMRANADAKSQLEQLQKVHKNLQDEYQRVRHNLQVSEVMVVQLSHYIENNCSLAALREALKPRPNEQNGILTD